MRLQITHETRLAYYPAVGHANFVLRQTPHTDSAQFVRNWRIDVSVDCWIDHVRDVFGNVLSSFSLKGPLEEVILTATGEVEVDDTHGVYSDGADHLPPEFFLRETSLAAPAPDLQDLADSLSGKGPLEWAHALNNALFERLKYEPARALVRNAAESLSGEKVSAAEGAQIFAAALRLRGVASRLVSGYLHEPARPELCGQHFWAECHIEALGWVGFDPMLNRCPTDGYVRVTVGSDFPAVAPIRDTSDYIELRTRNTRVTVSEASPRGRHGQPAMQEQVEVLI